ncbi:hypothetical protein ABDD95_13290 [Mucilaginibacter sp. PAMB04274]|uniref:hypothetical protein n=1 Tax=Mucilaginibacter sp. PAMB04274 TaxID=3138568 RepID=UPI0031F69034
MDQRIISSDTTAGSIPLIRSLYDRYGHALLGYITEVVQDAAKAEYYLVEIFKQISRYADELTGPGVNTWVQLQAIARNTLRKDSEQLGSAGVAGTDLAKFNKYTRAMNQEQKLVFNGVYYQHKSITILAKELNRDESAVKRILKEAFNVIRNEQ